MQSIANVTARKREGFREMQAAAEDGDLDAEYRLAISYANGEDGHWAGAKPCSAASRYSSAARSLSISTPWPSS